MPRIQLRNGGNCKGNISSVNEILTLGFKSERKLFVKKIETHRFIKKLYQSRAIKAELIEVKRIISLKGFYQNIIDGSKADQSLAEHTNVRQSRAKN